MRFAIDLSPSHLAHKPHIIAYAGVIRIAPHVKAQKIFAELKELASFESNRVFLEFHTPSKLRAKNYVGTIQTKSGFCVEILPKTFVGTKMGEQDSSPRDCTHKYRFEREKILQDFSYFSDRLTAINPTPQPASDKPHALCEICQAKSVLLNCLATLKNTPFKHNHLANLHTLHLPLLEIFVRMFLDECERLVKAGLKSDYLCIAQNRVFLKGKLEFKDHITQNLIHKERFFTSSDEYTQDIAPNRLIHSTLRILSRLNLSPSTQTKLDSMRFIFADISLSENIQADFIQCQTMSRAKEYEMIISWCKVFLEQRAFSPYAGGDKAMAFLFPMEKLFESFVGFWLKKCAKDFKVKTQESGKYLLQDEENKDIFCLKPDIIMRGKDRIIIVDTKWKIPDSNSSEKKYGISQSDLYQMWAYASKYRLESKHVRVVLVYPQCERTKELEKSWQNKQWTFKASKMDLESRDSINASKMYCNGISISLAFAPILS